MKKNRRFVALSEYPNGQDADAIMSGGYSDCVKACARDDAPCHVVEVSTDADGDEVLGDDILFVNRAWNTKYVYFAERDPHGRRVK